MKLVLDTNVYIAAFLSKGLASEVLELGEAGRIEIYTSKQIIREVETRLIEKLKLDRVYVKDFVRHINNILLLVSPKEKLNVIKTDPDDNKILECAVKSEANLIITMDKHLLRLKSYRGIGVVHPKTLTWILPKLF